MTTKKQFIKKIEKLNVEQIKQLISCTWNEATGGLFREIGFEILENRLGKQESDRIYAELWHEVNA